MFTLAIPDTPTDRWVCSECGSSHPMTRQDCGCDEQLSHQRTPVKAKRFSEGELDHKILEITAPIYARKRQGKRLETRGWIAVSRELQGLRDGMFIAFGVDSYPYEQVDTALNLILHRWTR